jgi:hypothetical protein
MFGEHWGVMLYSGDFTRRYVRFRRYILRRCSCIRRYVWIYYYIPYLPFMFV